MCLGANAFGEKLGGEILSYTPAWCIIDHHMLITFQSMQRTTSRANDVSGTPRACATMPSPFMRRIIGCPNPPLQAMVLPWQAVSVGAPSITANVLANLTLAWIPSVTSQLVPPPKHQRASDDPFFAPTILAFPFTASHRYHFGISPWLV